MAAPAVPDARQRAGSVAAEVADVSGSRLALALAAFTGALALVAAAVGLLWTGGDAPATVVSVHGEVVELYGRGLYRFDSVFKGAGNRGTDAMVLLVGVPLLLASLVTCVRRPSPRAALLLTGALTWFAYLYATLAVGTAHNELFLVYVALFATSTFALALTLRAIPLTALARVRDARLRRAVARFLVISGGLTLVAWLVPLVVATVRGEPPALLDHATTTVTEALDLAIVVPLAFTAAALLRRRDPRGYSIAVPLLTLIAVLAPVIVAQTVSQLAAGLVFTPAEVVGPIGGFVVLGSVAVRLLQRVLTQFPTGASRDDRSAP